MRDLHRFPVVAEIRMKVRADSSFPNDKTFTRFGSKSQFAAKILDYCQGKPDYEDVSTICSAIAKHSSARVESGEIEVTIGFVYLMKAGRYYKIGRSNSAGRREYELTIQLPEKPNTVHAIRTDDPQGIEAYWHNRFAAKRKNGEWFDLDASDVGAFKRRKFM
jgi:hypothetical protein